MKGVLEKSSHTNRPALPQERVKLLKDCFNYKYSYPVEKSEKVWSGIKNAINNKGRNQKRILSRLADAIRNF